MPAARRSRLIKHVELDPERGESFMGILGLFCQGEDDALFSKPLPEVAMTRGVLSNAQLPAATAEGSARRRAAWDLPHRRRVDAR